MLHPYYRYLDERDEIRKAITEAVDEATWGKDYERFVKELTRARELIDALLAQARTDEIAGVWRERS